MKSLRATLLLVYMLWIFLFLPLVSRKKVLSPFHRLDEQKNREIEEYKNAFRWQESKKYIENLDKSSSESARLHNCTYLVVAIVEQLQTKMTTTQLLALLHADMEGLDQQACLFVCNGIGKTAEMEKLSKHFVVETVGLQSRISEQNRKLTWQSCLQLAAHVPSKYSIFITESVLPYGNMLRNVDHLIKFQIESTYHHGEPVKRPDWLFAHLYEWYGSEKFMAYELIVIGVAGSGMLTFLSKFLLGKPMRSHTACIGLFGAVVFLTMAVTIGKVYVNELRRMSVKLFRIYEPDCVMPLRAIVMPSAKLGLMLSYLKEIDCSPYVSLDGVFYHAMYTLQVQSYAISPTLFRYI